MELEEHEEPVAGEPTTPMQQQGAVAAPMDDMDEELGEEELAPGDGTLFAEELRLEAKIEAILFASPKPLKASEIVEILQVHDGHVDLSRVQVALDALQEIYLNRAAGFQLKYIKRMGYQFQTVKAAARYMESMFSSRPRPISRSALETLAIIAYRQPVTRAEIEFIRGVDAGSIFKSLMDRGLITCVGRKEIAGRPMLFGTTEEFLKIFQIGSVKDLPPLESFQVSQELVQKTNEMIDKAVNEIAVEEFIKDEEYNPEAGADLMSDAPVAEPTVSATEERGPSADA